jgi:predicted HTH transcriptional regulator
MPGCVRKEQRSRQSIECAFSQIPNSVFDSSRPPIIPEIYEKNILDRIIIVISIAAGNSRPYSHAKEGVPKVDYARIGNHTRRAAPEQLDELSDLIVHQAILKSYCKCPHPSPEGNTIYESRGLAF